MRHGWGWRCCWRFWVRYGLIHILLGIPPSWSSSAAALSSSLTLSFFFAVSSCSRNKLDCANGYIMISTRLIWAGS
ncbi:hypothetical protein M441DRAFT_294318 [Trichoderma asperellum CBS 433.97]|uniref:Uncharacterized protein n=1 Tax=Trichoderma asperellum (strain ATCC 204424 / CBS 433.97 / NBRC 101777) TaxID=1042311 RepID=A0A2T3YTF4_TRIA4|nr:hypothetical protein M441DRAFT_294318 [Trichoderma asperellum CBS 433.97]PTB35817.1 hypothetical protein M441DRAFT_294318 [Trichoderma asperellum CBS 433.97]